jgi:hypothetical protein
MRARRTNPYCTRPRSTARTADKELVFATGRALAAAPRWNNVLNQVEEDQVQEDQVQEDQVQEDQVVDLNTAVQIEVCLDGSRKLQTTYTRAAYLRDNDSFEALLYGVAEPGTWSSLTVTAFAETDSDHAAMHDDRFAGVCEVEAEELATIIQEDILGLYPALDVQNPVPRRHWKFMIWTGES